MNLENISAGIVLYNPDIERLNENIRQIKKQVNRIFLVDNGSNNIEEVKKIYNYNENIILIENKCNLGIAYALNQIMSEARKKMSKWCLLLDQDTVCPSNLINLYSPYTRLEGVAVITPTILDRNKKEESVVNSKEFDIINSCITSASLNSIDIWTKIGGFDNNLFIDAVDHDYCIRLNKFGYSILKINKAIILHEIGKITTHRFLLWDINIFNHSAFRKYYINRNIIYIDKKHKGKNFFKPYLRIIKQGILVLLYEEDKKKKLNAIHKGVIDGIKMAEEYK